MQKIPADIVRLHDILNAVAEVERVQMDTADPRTKALASAYMIAVIGEAAKHLSELFRLRYADVPWTKISNMRNKIIHGYSDLDYEILEDVIRNYLPSLKGRVKTILEQES